MARPKIAPGSWGTITIRPTESGNFVARANYRRTDGKSRETEARGASKSAAQSALLEKLVAVTGTSDVTPDMPFAALVNRYMNEAAAISTLSESTLHEERRLLTTYVIPALGELARNELAGSVVHDFLIGMFKKTPTQAKNTRTALKKVYDYGSGWTCCQ